MKNLTSGSAIATFLLLSRAGRPDGIARATSRKRAGYRSNSNRRRSSSPKISGASFSSARGSSCWRMQVQLKRSSSPKPVSKVRSTSMVSRGSPQRCKARPPIRQNRQLSAVQRSWSSWAARMTSSTAGGFHEPALLLHESRRRLGISRGNPVVGRPAEERDGVFRIEPAQFLPAHLFQRGGGCLPGPHPALAEGDLIGRPIREARSFRVHVPSITGHCALAIPPESNAANHRGPLLDRPGDVPLPDAAVGDRPADRGRDWSPGPSVARRLAAVPSSALRGPGHWRVAIGRAGLCDQRNDAVLGPAAVLPSLAVGAMRAKPCSSCH